MASWFSSPVTRTQAHQYTASITVSRLNIREETRQRKTKVVGHCGYSRVDKYRWARLGKVPRVRNIFAGVDPTLSSTVTSCHEIRPSGRRDAEAWGKKQAVLQLYTKQIFIHTYFRNHNAPRSPSHILCSVTSLRKLNTF